MKLKGNHISAANIISMLELSIHLIVFVCSKHDYRKYTTTTTMNNAQIANAFQCG